ncbi:MAG: YhbY family RNA-binding protein [Pseudomonadota bacterium]
MKHALNQKQLRQIGHQLKSVVMISDNGLTPNILDDIDLRLDKNELIKIKVAIEDRTAKKALILDICNTLHAELIQQTGHTALLLRYAETQDPKLSNLLRPLD